MKLVLDTSIYCDYAEGIPDIVETIANSGEIIYLPAIIIAELSFGFMNGNKQEYNERKLQYIIDQLQIEIINVNQNIARKYALIYFHLVKKGRKIPINDVWIAACCMESGATLFTRNKHFKSIELIDCLPIKQ